MWTSVTGDSPRMAATLEGISVTMRSSACLASTREMSKPTLPTPMTATSLAFSRQVRG